MTVGLWRTSHSNATNEQSEAAIYSHEAGELTSSPGPPSIHPETTRGGPVDRTYVKEKHSATKNRHDCIHTRKRPVACDDIQAEIISAIHLKNSTAATVHYILSLGGS
jgi:hypothetical protein